jgi:hypothetical protein
MKRLVTFLFVISFLAVNAQPTLSWQKTYGGSNHEYTWKTIPVSGGGYAFVGFSESSDGDVSANHGGVDLWVAKIDAAGTIVWSYLYGGTEDEEGTDIIQTADGGFMVVGWTDSQDGDVTGHHGTYGSDFWVLKLTSAGALTWAKCYGGNDDDDDAAALVQSQNGNFYISGTTYSYDGDVSGNHGTYESDFWVIKVNAAGTLLGQKCVGGTEYEEGINMALTNDNGCVLTGRSYSTDGDVSGYHDGSDMLVAKLDSSFNLAWANCFGGSETEEGNSIVQLADNSYAALGYTSTHNNGDITGHHGSQGSDDFWLVRINTGGSLISAKCYGGDGDDQADGLKNTTDGGFVMVGLTNSTNGDVSGFHTGGWDPDIWVAKVDASGIFQWQRCCGGSGQDEAFNVFEEGSGIFVVTGFTYSADYDVTLNRGSADGWILKVTGSAGINENPDENLKVFWPNPADDRIFVDASVFNEIKIYDLSGKLIWCSDIPKDGIIILPQIIPGLYFAEFSGIRFHAMRKLELL